MGELKIIIESDSEPRVYLIEGGTWLSRSLTLVIEQLDRLLPLLAGNCVIHVLSDEPPSTIDVEGVRVSQLVDAGRVTIKLLDNVGNEIKSERELLERLVVIPYTEEPKERIAVHQSENTVPHSVAGVRGTDISTTQDETDHANIGMNQSGQTSGVRIQVWENALQKARDHARGYSYEVGGICVGRVTKVKSPDTWLVEITDTFVAQQTVNRGASVTFTPDTWSEANRTIDRDYASSGEHMVGWYHTHPGFGVFLSSHDLFLHENFFSQPWHIALVIDPVRKTEGFFAWTTDGHAKAVRPCRNEYVEIRKGRYYRSEVSIQKSVPEQSFEQTHMQSAASSKRSQDVRAVDNADHTAAMDRDSKMKNDRNHPDTTDIPPSTISEE